ncbi:MAG: ATP-dependent zinc protease [Pseudomonadota bacterium]
MSRPPITIGWREWLDLPDLGLSDIKAKIDTGARTSALHAFEVTPFQERGRPRVRFSMHPVHRSDATVQVCEADIVDERLVTNSGGQRDKRYVIETTLCLAGSEWPIEVTLTARDDMMFRMLLGRTAMRDRLIVDPSQSYLMGKRHVRP